ncbi:MAG: AI-2E family transporter [Bacteroidaceae bacterium]|nr:AI-2E family transporter [Bacteroidaceae bacterium]
MNREITFDRFIRGLMTIAGIIIAYMLISRLSGALLPFLIAWLFCYLVYPIVKFFQYRLKFKSRVLSIITVLLLVTALMVCLSFAIIPPIIQEAVMLKEFVTNYLTSGSTANNIPDVVNNFIREHIDMRQVEAYFSADRIGELIKSGLPKLWRVVSQSFSLVSGVVAAFMVLVYVFFILNDYETLAHGWVRLIPEKYRERVLSVTRDVEISMSNYFRGQSLIALCVGILFSIGFLIIDFPMAIGFGLFVGLLNIVPYLQITSIVPMIFLSLVKAANTGENFWWILIAAGMVMLVVQIIQETILIPRIMNKAIGLHPAVILLSLSIWGSLLGLVGMIIALPATSLILSYYRRFLRKQAEEEKVEAKACLEKPQKEGEE